MIVSLLDEGRTVGITANSHAVANLVAGTAWLFAREELEGMVDTLVVDEAGQLSLANVLAVAGAADRLVLVGDHATMPEGLGLFLDRTHRLHPDICRFTSEQVYDGRLESEPHCAGQAIDDGPVVGGTGLRWLSVDHESNRTSSVEEAHAVAEAFEALLGRGWTDGKGQRKTLGIDDVLVVAPYNAQVHLLAQHLPEGARIGTVDKFQGQQAPVVLVSMTASSAEDVPRGMEFL